MQTPSAGAFATDKQILGYSRFVVFVAAFLQWPS